MSSRRVVVTGLGIVSPVGSSLDLAWSNILAGKSGIGPITGYDVSLYTTRFAGLVSADFKPEDAMGPKELRKTDPFIHYGVAACKQAVRDAGLDINDSNRERIGVLVGSGIGGIGKIEDEVRELHKAGPKRVSPFFVPGSIINMVSGYASIELGIAGPSFATVSACTTAAHSIGVGARLIQAGDCDVCLAGGAEAGSSPEGMAGFSQARSLSKRNDEPQRAS
ncbi:MAG: beta-ketoacyl synthase N-terminal-like domain-containing protein, partial [Panacagrimonas sp.]